MRTSPVDEEAFDFGEHRGLPCSGPLLICLSHISSHPFAIREKSRESILQIPGRPRGPTARIHFSPNSQTRSSALGGPKPPPDPLTGWSEDPIGRAAAAPPISPRRIRGWLAGYRTEGKRTEGKRTEGTRTEGTRTEGTRTEKEASGLPSAR